jgi:DNA-binding CsgD family transcriptional regulator
MGRLTAAEAAEFRRIRAACSQDLDPPELLALVGARLRRFLGADAFCANEVDPATLLLTSAASEGWPTEARAPFLDRVYLRTPAADPGRLLQDGRRTLDVHQVLAGADSPRHDPFFQFHLLPFGYWYDIQLLCAVGGTAHAHFAWSRSFARGRFQDRHLRLLDALAPHVASGLARARLRGALRVAQDGRPGLLVLDDEGRVELANRAAEDWLTAAPPAAGALGFRLLARQAARVVLRGPDLAVAPVTELRHPQTGAPYRIHWEPRADAQGRPRLLVLLEPVRRLDRPETLRRAGLTERESQVALAVVRGLATKELAARLRLSPHTARQHLKRVFGKLGVSSRSELAGLLLGAAVAPGPPSPRSCAGPPPVEG